ncbi:hypothetical protein CRENBAI_011283 [Crenichthys baileyi]|uniref:Uncharacterized protein n=1 Tax=Crenichthys baileyi TaxID=28760 RepID=A0AAV9RUI0_9TELE
MRASLAPDQITARLTDRCHQCATQAAAMTKSIVFLTYAISKTAREMDLPPEDVKVFCNFAHNILNICVLSAVCSSCWHWVRMNLLSSQSSLHSRGPEQRNRHHVQEGSPTWRLEHF